MHTKFIVGSIVGVLLILFFIIRGMHQQKTITTPLIEENECLIIYTIDRNAEYTGTITQNDFDALTGADATSFEATSNIGIYKSLDFKKHSPRDILVFLFESETITTYRHLEANLCMINESDDQDLYTADFEATHEYCTNECITAEYKFSIQINKQDGTISLLPANF